MSKCPDCDVEMARFGPPLSGPWRWECPTCGHSEPTGEETPMGRLKRKYADPSDPRYAEQ